MKKVALFSFNGEPMCFVHVLLNGLDMKERGFDVKVVIEGTATKLVPDLAAPGKPFAALYEKAKGLGIVDCVCKACANKMGTLASAEEQGLTLCDEMMGHPSAGRYLAEGYEVIAF
jgi:hypothetical protein